MIRFLFVVIVMLGGIVDVASGQEAPSGETLLLRARVDRDSAKDRFEVIQRLYQRGSASETSYRQAEIEFKLAKLKLLSLEEPERSDANELAAAKLVADYREWVWGLAKRLAAKRSLSTLRMQRMEVAARLARLQVDLLENKNELEKQKVIRFKIAAIELEQATQEHDSFKTLYEKRSISKSDYDRVARRLEIVRSNWSQRKESLNASAEILKPDRLP